VSADKQLTICLDKALYHYTHNRTKILVVAAILLSRDPPRAPDVAMKGHPVHGYFSNFIEDKGYLMTFPLQLAQVRYIYIYNNNNNDRLTAFDPGQPG